MKNKIDLNNKRVLITGAGMGIGAAIAEAMASSGANICLNVPHINAAAEEFKEYLKDTYQIDAILIKADISIPAEVDHLFQELANRWGGLDILVNNAGVESVADCLELPLEEWDRIFSVNLRGAFYVAQLAGRMMKTQQQGCILNISSIHDKVARKGLIHYCSSKAGLNMLTKCMALELAADGVRVIAVSPGAIETDMNKDEIEKFGRHRFNEWIPLARVGKTEEVAWTCAFLASDLASYITGTEIYIDGGYKESTIQYDPRK
ncbi:SDR family NAD(P)-dependent oxidoreductase [Flavihumibacter sp. UBA7668]|uniref:SDR family NAD(P)-dependent oxidoreductase n=1 Tax=Flavihumibacter sp. UBA7668 TaxID=1946542 RepID=UPI0025B9055B|nr:SDR family oxidoreductase [Flavihumibacter sp. UBA7668]